MCYSFKLKNYRYVLWLPMAEGRVYSMVNVAVMGHGVVGSGVVELLLKNAEHISEKVKDDIFVKYILDLRDFNDLPYKDKFIKTPDPILEDDSVRVVVEVMGGIEPAYTYVKKSLQAGKSVVTSNKELVAAKGAELLRIAEEKNVNFLFEASVGGGIPVLRPIAQCLSANEIYQVAGILNGTTNFILTKMVQEKMPFDKALKLAQDLGYAERNPSADVDGHDACRKICILASLAYGKHVYPNQVQTEGISAITLADAAYAADFDSVIKLIGRSKRLSDTKITATVYPALVSNQNQLAGVEDVFNAVMVQGDAVGDVLFYGRGAGKLPTASAVVADVMDCVKHLQARKYLSWEEGDPDYVADPLQDDVRLYVRATAQDKAAAVAELEKVFGQVTLLKRRCAPKDELAYVTPHATERTLRKELEQLKASTALSILHILD